VEFIAYYRPKNDNNQRLSLHELSSFRQDDGRWYYVDGITPTQKPKKTGRNDACPCGSGKKFKKCCDA
jgi:SEC-C motif-containing protein